MDVCWDKLSYPRVCALISQGSTRLSAAMHNAAFSATGLPFVYTACVTTDTKGAVEAARILGLRGLSVSIPHKERACALVDELSPSAKEIGAVNTVINDGMRLRGENTDWTGVLATLAEAKVETANRRTLILGAGGAARAVVYALRQHGVGEIVVANRSLERARSLGRRFGLEVLETPLTRIDLSQFGMIVNTTPVGSVLLPDEPFLDCATIAAGAIVFDIVTAETPLLKAARKRQAQAVAGVRMLLFQAAEQFRLFTGEEPPIEVMDRALRREIKAQEKVSAQADRR